MSEVPQPDWAASRLNTPRPTTNRSGTLPAANPKATRNAFAWGSGNAASIFGRRRRR